MKRCWIGLGLLLLLLAAGALSTWRMGSFQKPIIAQVEASQTLAGQGDWDGAEAAVQSAQAQWEQGWGLSAALTDHAPMEQIDVLFAQLQVYAHARETAEYQALCAQVAVQLESMGDAHVPTWWNLL